VETKIQVQKVNIPVELLSCAPAPVVPVLGVDWDKAVGEYIVSLSEAGEDCRSKLGKVKALN